MLKNKHYVFDLDDTLYKEIDFVKSAYNYIVKYVFLRYNIDLSEFIDYAISKNLNFFDLIHSNCDIDLDITTFLELYRFHVPNIKLDSETKELFKILNREKIKYSIITDGRSISQRNKLNALSLSDRVSTIVISQETGHEKPHKYNFDIIQKKYSNSTFIYVGDNTTKDFIAPNKLGWHTVCLLDNGKNIHKQNFNLNKSKMPKSKVSNISNILHLWHMI